jgi:hypothetical protein
MFPVATGSKYNMGLHPQAQAIAAKIQYALNMLQYCSTRIQNEWADADDCLRNLLLEDFLLHARILRDFFVGSPREDDVSAAHFFDDPSYWLAISASFCPYLKQHKTRLDKYLAHLTYSRLNEDKNWDLNVIHSEIAHAGQQFYSLLPPERQAWFQ